MGALELQVLMVNLQSQKGNVKAPLLHPPNCADAGSKSVPGRKPAPNPPL